MIPTDIQTALRLWLTLDNLLSLTCCKRTAFGVNKTAVITLLFLHASPHTAVDHSNTVCVFVTILAVLSEPA